ncbi:glycosyltransferase family 2 protein [Alicyclobacillus sp. SO9]|uniref:glycosyltransferase family 2 protein n=1 Tax=Alicyclobacillus sp. SO9 TaxID=2665646 RepID=UPI0018E77BB0|nr:glycosyltransferase family 2 protein [Alicyclobacillus sp. SO9]
MLTIWTQTYNDEKYIGQCIESVLKQSYPDFEYIIVDDGSTDDTWAVIEDYARKDPRIRAFHHTSRAGGIRYNLMLDTIHGEYFAVLDSDDWLERDFLAHLVGFCKTDNLDMCVCGTQSFDEATGERNILRNSDAKLSFTFAETPYYFRLIHSFLRPVWGKLIRTEVLRKADLSVFQRFMEQKYKGFDTAFTIGLFESSQRIGVLNQCLHNYRVRENSSFSAFSETRYDAYEELHEQSIKLLSRFGPISSENQEFMSMVFFNAVKDALDICIRSPLPEPEKLTYVASILGKPKVLELRKEDTGEGLELLVPYVAWFILRANTIEVHRKEFSNLLKFIQPKLLNPISDSEWDALLDAY